MSSLHAPPPASRFHSVAGATSAVRAASPAPPASLESESARHVVASFAAATAAARDAAAGSAASAASAEAAISRVRAAVTDYAVRCRAGGVPPQRALVRLNDLTQRHVVVLEQQPRADELSAVVFRAFLAAYYGPDGG